MPSYERPMVTLNDGEAEGVYMGSGKLPGESSADCWTVDAYSVQDWAGDSHVFEVHATHTTAVVHVSTACTVTLTFNNTIASARSEFPCTWSGNTVTIVRTLHANAYNSGDSVTYKVWVYTGDEATTKAIACTGATISCTKTANVQGGFD